MKETMEPGTSRLLPILLYRDLTQAVGWFERAFGMTTQTVLRQPSGLITYAELRAGESLLMLSTLDDADAASVATGIQLQHCYVVIDDAVAHCARSKAAGAVIINDVRADTNGRSGYACCDPEGHVWSFGTYDPIRAVDTAVAVRSPVSRSPATRVAAALVGMGALAIAAAGGWLAAIHRLPDAQIVNTASTQPPADKDPGRVEAQALARAKIEAQALRASLFFARRERDGERSRRNLATLAASRAREVAEAEKAARLTLEQKSADLARALEAERIAKEALQNSMAASSSAPLPVPTLVPPPDRDAPAVTANGETPSAAEPPPPSKLETSAIPQPADENSKTSNSDEELRPVPTKGSQGPHKSTPSSARRASKSDSVKPAVKKQNRDDRGWPYSEWNKN